MKKDPQAHIHAFSLTRYVRTLLLLITLLVGLVPTFSYAAGDPSRAGRDAVSPKQIGSVGQSTGAMNYAYPLTLPPGRNGMTPNLELNYSSADKRQDSFFGYGWSLGIPYIERINKLGTDNLYDSDKQHTFFYSSLSGEILPFVNSTPVGGAFLATSLSTTPLLELDSPSQIEEATSTPKFPWVPTPIIPTTPEPSVPTNPSFVVPPTDGSFTTTQARDPGDVRSSSIKEYQPDYDKEFQLLREKASAEALLPNPGTKQRLVTNENGETELVGEREENIKVFLKEENGQEEKVYRVFQTPIHYLDEANSEFKDINSQIEVGSQSFTVQKAPYHLTLGKGDNDALLTFTHKSQTFSINFVPETNRFLAESVESTTPTDSIEMIFTSVSSTIPTAMLSSTPAVLFNMASGTSDETSTLTALSTDSGALLSDSQNSASSTSDTFSGVGKSQAVRADTLKISKGEKTDPIDSHRVVYPSFFKEGVDLEITALNDRVTKDIVIEKKSAVESLLKNDFIDFTFDIAIGGEFTLTSSDGARLDKDPITSSSPVTITSRDGTVSYIYPPIFGDASGKETLIDIVYTKTSSGFRMTKKVPTALLSSAEYPVRVDATFSYTPLSGDGFVRQNDPSWSTAHDSLVGNNAQNYWGSTITIDSTYNGTTQYYNARGFLPFDTSAIPDSSIIASANLYIVPDDRIVTNGTAQNYLALVGPTAQVSTSTLASGDYNECGATTSPTLLSAKYTWQQVWPVYNPVIIPLNSAGTSSISKTGVTYLGIRTGFDIENVTPSGQNAWVFRSSSYTSYEPYLEITTVVPTGLQVNGYTNPANIASTSPAFSAIFKGNATNTAQYFRLQVSTSTTWTSPLAADSGKVALSTSTANGVRTPNMFATSTFSIDGTKYYWRVKFWNQSSEEGDWSGGTDFFVTQISGSYMAKVDDGSFVRYTLGTDGAWTAYDKRGWKYTFGATGNARINNSTAPSEIYRWYLEQVTDPNGNRILYNYAKDSGQVYPDSVLYTDKAGGSLYQVTFLKGGSAIGGWPNAPFATSSVYGFPVYTKYLINDITVSSAVPTTQVIHRFRPQYTTGDNGKRVILSGIRESGYKDSDGSGELSVATSTFAYQQSTTAWTEVTDANSWQVNFNFSDNSGNALGYRVFDANGDGLPDIVRADGSLREVYFNTGTKWESTASSTWTIPVDFSISNTDMGVRTADVNGDGLIDLIAARTFRQVYLNNGTDTWVASSTITFPENFTDTAGRDMGVQLADVNGDGMADVLRSYHDNTTGTTSKVYLSTGSGWVYDAGWTVPELFIDEDPSFFSQTDPGTRLYDYTGDGLVDIIRSNSISSGIVRAYVNNGRGWDLDASAPSFQYFSDGGGLSDADKGVRFTDLNADGYVDEVQAYHVSTKTVYLRAPGGSGVSVSGTFPEAFRDSGGHDLGVYLEDVNGDGQTDVLRGYYDGSSNYRKVYLKNGDTPDLLKTVVNSKGGKTTVMYQSSARYFDNNGAPANPKMPIVAQTARSITTDSGTAFASSGHRVIATTTYDYRGGYFFGGDPLNRQFMGYGNVTELKPSGTTVRTYFHQGDSTDSANGEFGDHISKAGRPYRVDLLDGTTSSANLYAKTISKWARADYADGRNFIKLVKTLAQTFDGDSSHRDVAEEMTYDDTKGNLTQRIAWGEVTGSSDGTFSDTGTDKSVSDYSYAASSTNTAVSLPSRELVSDQYSNVIRDAKSYYDSLSLGAVGIGNQTKQEYLISSSTSLYASTTKTYNSYGLVTQTTDPRGGTTTIVYDAYNMFPATSTNALGQSERFAYDYSSGQVVSRWNPHGYEFRTDYDNLDRPIKSWQPDMTTPSTLVLAKEYAYQEYTPGTVISAAGNSYAIDLEQSSSQYLKTGDTTALSIAGDFTIEFWVNFESIDTGVGELVSKYGGPNNNNRAYDIAYHNSGGVNYIETRISNTGGGGSEVTAVTFPHTVNTGTWYHWAFVYRASSGAIDFYQATTSAGTDALIGTMSGHKTSIKNSQSDFMVGNSTGNEMENSLSQFDGMIDDLRVWNVQRTLSELNTNKTTELTGSEANLVGYWKFNNTYNDSTANGQNFTAMNSPTFSTSIPFGQASSTDGAPAVVFERTYLTSATATDQYSYVDGFGRAVKVLRETEPQNGWIAADTVYDKDGRTMSVSAPYFISTSSYAAPTTTNYLLTQYAYDPAGRVSTTSDILGTTTAKYSDWFTRVTDPLGNTKDALKDAYGNLVAIGEKLTGSTATTTYIWNLNQKLTKITDASGNIRNFTYDNLGRSLLSEDLHSSADTTFGTTTRTYDIAGNIIKIVNPRAQTINYVYDALNRPTSEDFTGQSGTEVQYFYDTCTNGKGKLCSVRKQGEATTTYLYNPIGITSAEGKTIGLGTTQSTATTSYAYLINGKEDRIVYPDSAQVYYLYDNAGLLDKVLSKESGGATTSVVTRMTYSPLGQIEAQDFTNGVNSTSTYDKAQKYRLTNKFSKNSSVLQDTRYTYDAVGNITILDEQASTSARKTVIYTYDPLYRLLSASTTAVATGTAGYLQSFTYDALGNMLTGPSGSYTYAQTGYANPDAVTSLGGLTYGYDNAGNLTSSGSSTFTWDYNNRMASATVTIASTTVGSGGGGTSTATPAFVQSKKDSVNGVATFNSAVTTGNLVVVGVTNWNTSIPTNAVSDNKGNTYTRIVETINTASTDHGALFYAKNVTGGSSFTVTSSVGGTISVHEYSGISTSSPLDKVASSTGLSTSPNSGNVTTTLGNELYFGLAWSGQDGDTWTAANGFTLRENETNNATAERSATEDKVISTASTTFAKFSVPTSENWLAIVATFKPLVTTSGTGTATTTTYSTSTVTYRYDHTGSRVEVKDFSTTTAYFGKLYQQTPNGYTKTKQIYAGGQLIATVEKKGGATVIPYYVLTDHLGGSNILTNASGTATQTLDYFPFGETRMNAKNTSFNEPRQYIGEVFDSSTNLQYLNARYMDAKRGQFTSQDPVFLGNPITQNLLNPQSLNSYNYANNNPIRYSDPLGLWGIETIQGIGAGWVEGLYQFLRHPINSTYMFGWSVGAAGKEIYDTRGGAISQGWRELQNSSDYQQGQIISPIVGVAIAPALRNISYGPAILETRIPITSFDAVTQQRFVLQGISNSALTETFKQLYKTADNLPGGTAGALVNEALTGQLVGGKSHLIKANESVSRLNNILKNEKLNTFDTQRAKDEITNLQGSINTWNSLQK